MKIVPRFDSSPLHSSQAALGPTDINDADTTPGSLASHREDANRAQVNMEISKKITWILFGGTVLTLF